MADANTATLTAYSYVTIVIFLLVVVLIIRPVKIRIGPHIKIYLNISTVPPLGVLILLVCRAINFDVVGRGFLGTLGVQPWAIMILFYSLVIIHGKFLYADLSFNILIILGLHLYIAGHDRRVSILCILGVQKGRQ